MANVTEGLARLTIDPSVEGENLQALQMLDQTVRTNPSALETAIGLFAEAPEAVGAVVDYLYKNPENLGIVAAWRRLSKERLDGEIEFDPETEEAIGRDAYFNSVKREFDLSNDQTREKLREKVRARRWRIFISRAQTQDAA